jgi:hypothetical protein
VGKRQKIFTDRVQEKFERQIADLQNPPASSDFSRRRGLAFRLNGFSRAPQSFSQRYLALYSSRRIDVTMKRGSLTIRPLGLGDHPTPAVPGLPRRPREAFEAPLWLSFSASDGRGQRSPIDDRSWKVGLHLKHGPASTIANWRKLDTRRRCPAATSGASAGGHSAV